MRKGRYLILSVLFMLSLAMPVYATEEAEEPIEYEEEFELEGATATDTIVNWAYCGAEGTEGKNVKWILYSSGTLKIEGTGAMKNCTSYTGSPLYNLKSQITKCVIDEGVTNIGDYMFVSCSNMKTISIPSTVESIGKRAFAYCRGLTSITLPTGLKRIGDEAFVSCEFSRITIPSTVTQIDVGAFMYCKNITSITIPKSVTKLGDGIIGGSTCAVTSLRVEEGNPYYSDDGNNIIRKGNRLICTCNTSVITDNVSIIGQYSLSGYGKRVVVMPESIEELEQFACTLSAITGIEWNSNIKKIGNYAFSSCDIESIELPENVVYGDSLFSGCNKLKEVVMPSTYTYVYTYDFKDCSSLESITFKGVVNGASYDAFAGTPDTMIIKGLRGTGLEKDCIRRKKNFSAIGAYVTFDANGGNCDTTKVAYWYDAPIEALPVPTCEGKIFEGWYDYAEGGTLVEGYNPDILTELYAHWTEKPRVDTYSLSFDTEKIGLNYYVCNLDSTLFADGKVVINGKKYRIPEAEENGTYKFTTYVNAKEMNKPITIAVYDGKDRKINLDNLEAVDGTVTKSVRDYLNSKKDEDTKQGAFIGAVDTYGLCAQRYFEYEDYANVTVVPDVDMEDYKCQITRDSSENIRYKGSTLLLKDGVKIRCFFTMKNDYYAPIFRINGEEVEYKKIGNTYYIEQDDIKATDMGTAYVFSASNGDDECIVEYSVLSYCYDAINVSDEEKMPLRELAKSIYWYYETARDYFVNE